MTHWEFVWPETLEQETPPQQRLLPVALLSGAAVYTTFRLPIAGQWFQAHLARLQDNAEAIGLIWPNYTKQLYDWIHRTAPPDEPVVRLTAYADVSAYGELFQTQSLSCRLLLSTRPLPSKPPVPLALKTVYHTRPFAQLKLASLGDVIYLKRQAISEGYHELLLLNDKLEISEASTANFFALNAAGILRTPKPDRDGCLPGITRQQVLDIAQVLQIPTSVQTPLNRSDLLVYQAAFLTNAVQGLVPVGQIDQHILPWPAESKQVFQTLQAAWERSQA